MSWWYKRYGICLISINFIWIASSFFCANDIGSLLDNFFGVRIFNFVHFIFPFRAFNFTLSAIVCSGCNFTHFLAFNGGIGGQSYSSNSRINFSCLFRIFNLLYKCSESWLNWVVHVFESLSNKLFLQSLFPEIQYLA